jgi:hypothetical protein
MNSTSWVVSNIVLFLVVGVEMLYIATRYKTYAVQMKKLPRVSLCVMAFGCLLWGTGWLFQLCGSGVLESVFKVAGATLFVINVPLIFLRRAPQPTPPVHRNHE